MACIAFHRFHKIRDKVVALAQLCIDISGSLTHILTQADEIVVNPDHHNNDQNQ